MTEDAAAEGVNASSGYRAEATRSAMWSAGTAMGVRLLRTLSFFLLARFLTTDAFGQIALATALVSIVQVAGGLGMHQFLIRAPSVSPREINSVLWLSVVSGLVLSTLVAGGAPVASALLGEPSLTGVFFALSPLPLLAALSTVPTGILWRELQYRSLAVRNLVAALASSTISIGLALAGAGVWSLVTQLLVEALVGTAMLWFACLRWYRPAFQFELSAARRAASFGVRIVGADSLTLVSGKADDIIVGARLGVVAVGVYSVAYRVFSVLRETLQATSGTVAFSFFSRLQDEPARLRSAFLRATRVNAAVAFPVFIFISAASSTVVAVALGDTWKAAAPVVAVLSAVGVASVVTDMATALLVSQGHASASLRFSIMSAALNVGGFLAVVSQGIVWVALAFTIRAFLTLPIALWLIQKYTGVLGKDVLLACAPVLAACSGVAVFGVASNMARSEIGSPFALVASAALAALSYLGLLRVLSPATFEELRGMARELRQRGAGSHR